MLKFTFKALCKLEKLSGMSFENFMKKVEENKSFCDVATIWQAGRCFEKDLTFDEACNELDNIGWVEAFEQIKDAVTEAFSRVKGDKGETENPQVMNQSN